MNLLNWWQERAVREKAVLAAAAIILLLTLVYLAFEPILQERQRLTAEIPLLREDLAWMQSQVSEIQQLSNPVTTVTDNSTAPALTLAMVEQVLRQSGMEDQVTDLRPLAGQVISIGFDKVSYANLVEFLYQLQQRSNAVVSQARINRIEGSDGVVNATLALTPGKG
jgi:general secretion pathway protein M